MRTNPLNRAQEKKHLAQANRHIAELMVQIVRQRVIVKYALDAGQRSETAESLLHAIAKEPRPIREASRTGSRSVEAPTVQVMGSSKRPDPPGDARRAKSRRVRLHRALLQLQTQTLDDRLSKPYGVRAAGRIRLTRRHPNRVQAKAMAVDRFPPTQKLSN